MKDQLILREREARDAAAKATQVLRRLLTENSRTFLDLVADIKDGKRPVVVQNLEGSALALVVAGLREKLARPILVLTAGMERAEQLVDDLEFFGVEESLHYPKWEVLPYDQEDLSLEVTSKHLDVFEALSRPRGGKRKPPPCIVAPIDATMQRVLPLDRLERLTVRFKWGDRVDLGKLAEQLDAAGYERVGLVESRGEFSIRGSIVDIFPPNTGDPMRLDLFGDEIESIRKFDIATQRSLQDLGADAEIAIPAVKLKHQIEEHLKAGKELVTLYDLLPADTLLVMDAPERYEEVGTYFESAVERQYNEIMHGKSELGPPERLIVPAAKITEPIAKFRRVEHTRLPIDGSDKATAKCLFQTGGFSAPSGDLPAWISAIRKRQAEDYLVVIACDNDGQVQRFDEVLRESEVSARQMLSEADTKDFRMRSAVEGYRDVLLVVGGAHEGFVFHDARIVLITDREVFGRYKRRHIYKKIYKGRPIAGSNDIQRGDFVVHVEHGIGKFTGTRQQVLDGRTVDLLEIVYDGGDKLLVPVEKIRYVQKYAGGDAEDVVLDKLGTNRWHKRRKKSTEEIEKMAEALLQLHARREVARRDPFGPDTQWQREFEASFPYQETPDQAKAIMEAKLDMERHRPMDRLVCGDVGYGKTEVAIRTVFKCVMEKRQAAVLVPTTILALQHYQSFKERYADYPVKVALLSRFQKAKEAKEIIAKVKTGEIDVVVGTHKLLGKEIEFRNLGLLVVDEEQRFGVKAKDRLKELRSEVDIVTLTATPIPRTLYMAMSGLRDLSLITTPPPDRHPIKTKIIHWEQEPIAEAILRELNRGGQVFFIHNRVHNIQDVANQLLKIVPHARIGVAHGQMDETELEDHMVKFIQGEYDILVSTTIVESGIDIPNANTIIVNRADAFGLAQLYQLRGRVGREKRRAYAYLIVPQGQAITDTAVRRLAAIEEFTELGSGFNIALRDMEIRGAGNLLGKEQHGIVNEIGFELYCELLQDAVARLRGVELHDQHDVEIKWPVSCYFPTDYVPVETQRVNFYKRLATMRMQEDVEDMGGELRDRYGELPASVVAMLEVTRLRLAAARMRVGLIDGSARPRVRLDLVHHEAEKWRDLLKPASQKAKGIVAARTEGTRTVIVQFDKGTDVELVIRLREFLNEAHAAKSGTAAAKSA